MASLQYLEAKLAMLRKVVSTVAAEFAAESSQNPELYRVERNHVDQAILEVFRDLSKYERDLGLTE